MLNNGLGHIGSQLHQKLVLAFRSLGVMIKRFGCLLISLFSGEEGEVSLSIKLKVIGVCIIAFVFSYTFLLPPSLFPRIIYSYYLE